MIEFTLYTANCTGNLTNCLYPNKVVIKDKDSFLEAIKFDHVSAEFKDSYRSNANFLKADNIVFDCDNEHSDDPKDWGTPSDVAMAFPGVPFVVSYSRNHMKQKGNRSPRPRFHVYFMVPVITDQAEYAALKQKVASKFPFLIKMLWTVPGLSSARTMRRLSCSMERQILLSSWLIPALATGRKVWKKYRKGDGTPPCPAMPEE